MDISPHFERTLFFDRSPAADEYYSRSAESIFEVDPLKSKIEVRIQSSMDVTYYERKQESGTSEQQDRSRKGKPEASAPATSKECDSVDARTKSVASLEHASEADHIRGADAHHNNLEPESDETQSLSSTASSTALSTALDQHRGSSPPIYPGPPKLTMVNLDTENIRSFVKSTRNDFRVFYLRQRHSFSRLQVTRSAFELLLKACHVFPRFNEYLIGFGTKHSESEVGPPPLKFRALCTSQNGNRHGFECSYILRYVEYTNRGGGKRPWSLRQFAVYHRFKPKSASGCSTWILVGASQRTELRLDRYTRSIHDLTGSNPFELHVIFLDTAIASWRPYLVDLTKLVTRQSDKAVGILVGCNEAEDDFITIEVEDHQELKRIEDQIADLILCLDSTLDTVSTFEYMYELFGSPREVINQENSVTSRPVYGLDAVAFALREKAKEIAYTRKKAEALLSKVQNTRTLISSLLERESGHNLNEQISALHKLERQGQEENLVMRELAEKNSRDSSSMRILTIITMIYLPCTIVSNFYSTQFVNQKELPSGESKLDYASNTYVFFAISVPLTVVTILVWYLWMNWQGLVHVIMRQSCWANNEASFGLEAAQIGRSRRHKSEWAASNA